MNTISVYFFNSLAALKARSDSQDVQTIFFYDGVPLEDAPSNCINVPIGTFYDYFLKTTYPQISQINFDNVDFSQEIKSQITQSITETITAIQNDKVEIINSLLKAEINEQNVTVMIFSFLKYLLEGADEKATTELITKLLKIVVYLQTHNYQETQQIQNLQTRLFESIQAKETSMNTIFLSFILKQLRDKTEFDKNRKECLEKINEYDALYDIAINFHYLTHIYKAQEFKIYVKDYANVLFKNDFFDLDILQQKSKIYKFFYATNQGFKFFEDFKEMYYVLKPLYLKAMELEQDELVMFLYYPLQFSWNGVAQTQEEHKIFNDEVELPLESYVKNTLIDKYKLKPNTKKIDPNQKKIKVAILIHRVLNLSVNHVMVSLLEAIKANPDKQYEFIVYDLNLMEMMGSDKKKVEELKKLGFKYVDLHYKFYDNGYAFYSIIDKTLKTRELLIKDKIDILIGYHNRAEYNFLFTSRTAPKQLYWSHGNDEYDLEEIDAKISHANNNDTKILYFNIPKNYEKYNPKVDMQEAAKIRSSYPKDSFILGSIGRLIKLDSDEYLQAVATIMKENPNTIYLACGGGGDNSNIKQKVQDLGIAHRFYFAGHVDAHLYAHVIDMFLSPFPFGGGEALEEYRSKGKPYVAMHLSDIFKDEKQLDFNDIYNNPNQVFMKKSLYTKDDLANIDKYNYLISENKHTRFYKHICVVTTQNDYVQVANRLIADENLREKMTQEYMFELQYNTSKTNGIYEVFKGLL